MTAVELGATLYVPATRRDVVDIAHGAISGLRSMVICLEDSIRDDEVERATTALGAALAELRVERPAIRVYVRPRSAAHLASFADIPGMESIEGFVLPKATAANLASWLKAMPSDDFRFMPTIETAEAFDADEMTRLRRILLADADRVTAVRMGGNDLLSLIGVRRSRERTIYDGPLGDLIRRLAGTFLPYGLAMSSPVLEHYHDDALLVEEVERDLEHGLTTKTAIHPRQVPIIQDCYRVGPSDLADAQRILGADAPGVFGSSGSMCEPKTHTRWAAAIVERSAVYGTKNPEPLQLIA